jgi:hypothetical protein
LGFDADRFTEVHFLDDCKTVLVSVASKNKFEETLSEWKQGFEQYQTFMNQETLNLVDEGESIISCISGKTDIDGMGQTIKSDLDSIAISNEEMSLKVNNGSQGASPLDSEKHSL